VKTFWTLRTALVLQDQRSTSLIRRNTRLLLFATDLHPQLMHIGAFDMTGTGKRFSFYMLQPISGMSRHGMQAAWLGLEFIATSEEKEQKQVPWRSILFEPLRLYEWQSLCISFSRKTNQIRLFLNGMKEVDVKNAEENLEIGKDCFSNSDIFNGHRGSISDLQVFSTDLEDEDLIKWTTCEFEKPGDVFQWDVKKINMTSTDEKMIISVNKIDTENFCQAKKGGKSKLHIFGQGKDINQIEGNILCKRLNGKYANFPKNEAGLKAMYNLGQEFLLKSNASGFMAWVGGNSRILTLKRSLIGIQDHPEFTILRTQILEKS